MRICMKEAVLVDHLRKDASQLLRDLISADIVLFEVLKVVDSASINVYARISKTERHSVCIHTP